MITCYNFILNIFNFIKKQNFLMCDTVFVLKLKRINQSCNDYFGLILRYCFLQPIHKQELVCGKISFLPHLDTNVISVPFISMGCSKARKPIGLDFLDTYGLIFVCQPSDQSPGLGRRAETSRLKNRS